MTAAIHHFPVDRAYTVSRDALRHPIGLSWDEIDRHCAVLEHSPWPDDRTLAARLRDAIAAEAMLQVRMDQEATAQRQERERIEGQDRSRRHIAVTAALVIGFAVAVMAAGRIADMAAANVAAEAGE